MHFRKGMKASSDYLPCVFARSVSGVKILFVPLFFTPIIVIYGDISGNVFSIGALNLHWVLKIEKMRRLGYSTHQGEQSFSQTYGLRPLRYPEKWN